MLKRYLFLFGLLIILWLAACEPGGVPPQLNETEVAVLGPTLTSVALGTPHPLSTLLPSETATVASTPTLQSSPTPSLAAGTATTSNLSTSTFTPSPTVMSTPSATSTPAATPTLRPTDTPLPSPTPIPTPSATSVASGSEESWLDYANNYRTLAGVPPAEAEADLSANCEQHARYMVQNNSLTHTQDLDLPGASPEGASCAQQGNVWLGTGRDWQITDPIEAWLGSVGHRMWLLYPTAQTFGYGFYKSGTDAGAALDILSGANLEADPGYTGWPVRYPAPGQTEIPATDYPITLTWPYFGPSPVLDSVELVSETGLEVPYTANTELPADHEGIQILPQVKLAPFTTYIITVTGSYEAEPFAYTWDFTTGDTPPLDQMTGR